MNSSDLGNINKDSIENAWNGTKMQHIRDSIINGDYQTAGCNPDCSIIRSLKNGNQFPIDFLDKKIPVQSDVYNNIILATESLSQKKVKIESFPFRFDIQANELCNMNCIMCKQDHESKERIDPNLYNSIFMSMNYITGIRFQGGEVFADKQFYPALLNLKKQMGTHQAITIIINGSILTHAMIDKLVEGNNPIKFLISIDSPNEKIYKKIRVTNQFNVVWSNFKYLAKKQQESGLSDLVLWNYMVSKSTLPEIKKSLRIANELGVTICFNPIVGEYFSENMFKYKNLFSKKQFVYLKQCIEFASKLNIKQVGLEQIIQNLAHHDN